MHGGSARTTRSRAVVAESSIDPEPVGHCPPIAVLQGSDLRLERDYRRNSPTWPASAQSVVDVRKFVSASGPPRPVGRHGTHRRHGRDVALVGLRVFGAAVVGVDDAWRRRRRLHRRPTGRT